MVNRSSFALGALLVAGACASTGAQSQGVKKEHSLVTLGITTAFKGTECGIEAEVGPAGCSFWTGTKSSAGELKTQK